MRERGRRLNQDRVRGFAAATLGISCLALAGCGFQPLYGDRSGHAEMAHTLSQVHVKQISDRLGVIMTNRLRDSFNPDSRGTPPRYELTIALTSSTSNETLRADATSSRTALALSASWALTATGGGKLIDSGTANANSGVDIIDANNYSTVVASNTEEDRMVREVSDEIQMRVAMALRKAS